MSNNKKIYNHVIQSFNENRKCDIIIMLLFALVPLTKVKGQYLFVTMLSKTEDYDALCLSITNSKIFAL